MSWDAVRLPVWSPRDIHFLVWPWKGNRCLTSPSKAEWLYLSVEVRGEEGLGIFSLFYNLTFSSRLLINFVVSSRQHFPSTGNWSNQFNEAVAVQQIHNYLFFFYYLSKTWTPKPSGKEQGMGRKGWNLSGMGILKAFYVHCNLTLSRLNKSASKAAIYHWMCFHTKSANLQRSFRLWIRLRKLMFT